MDNLLKNKPLEKSPYRKLSYIASNGTGTNTGQYIDTGVVADGSTFSWDIGFRILEANGEERELLASFGNKRIQVAWDTGFRQIGHTSTYTPSTVSVGTDYTVVGSGSGNSGSGGNRTFYLFAQNEGVANHNCSARLYYAKIYKTGTLVRDFIPVLKRANNEYGLLDKISGQFYGNLGIGSFTGG